MMTNRFTIDGLRRTAHIFGILLVSLVAASCGAVAAHAQNATAGASMQAAVASEPVTPDVRAVLQRFGRFQQTDRYGEVWIPTVTPPGWHPYPPCHWVKARRLGLYFDDQTEWGRIVHHYGRWVHDDQNVWMWTVGSVFSPGWVIWRSSAQWTGWVPMPPVQDEASMSADAMSDADSWLFQETPRLLAGCDGGAIAPPSQVLTLVQDTPFVRRTGIFDGLLVVIVPNWISGPFVDVKAVFKPWSGDWLVHVLSQWNWIWHHTTVATAKNVCVKGSSKL